jgi:outer membrane protein assembly factor BamB
MADSYSRRAVLRWGGIAGSAALAGCQIRTRSDDNPIEGEGASTSQLRPETIFRSDVERTGYWPDASPPDQIALEWSLPGINKGDHTAAKSSPLLYDGNVIVPGDVGTVYSVTPAGDLNWATAVSPSGFGIHATPAIVDGTIFITAYDGAVYAIDADSGDVEWRSKIADAIGSSPAFYDGHLYVATEFYTPSGGMSVLDAATGNVVWEDNRATNHCHSITGIDTANGVFAAGSNDGRVYFWELASRAFLGTFDTAAPVKGPICLFDGLAIFGSWDDHVYAVEVATQRQQWAYRTDAEVMSGAAVDPETNTVFIGSHDSTLYALDASSGDRQWSYSTGGIITGSPVVADGQVLIGSYDDALHAVDVATGRPIWRFTHPDGWVTSCPAIGDGTVYLTTRATQDRTGALYKLASA